MRKALLLIDIQNDYFTGGRMELDGMEQASSRAASVLKAFRERGLPVIHVRHVSIRPGATFFLPDTPGVEIHETVAPLPGEALVTKHFPNSFRDTGLSDLLGKLGVGELAICGAMTHLCIDATTRAAFDLSHRCAVVGDACATRDLVYRGTRVEAAQVHAAFLAALGSVYASIMTADDYIGNMA